MHEEDDGCWTNHPFRKVLKDMPGVKCVSSPFCEFSNTEMNWKQNTSPISSASDILICFRALLVSYPSAGGSSF